MRFRHDAQHFAPLNDGSAIEELIVVAHRQADDKQARELTCAGLHDLLQSGQRSLEQRRVVEEIAAGIGGEAEFGENEHIDRFGLGLLHQREGALGVELAVGNAELRHRRRDPQEPVMEHDETRSGTRESSGIVANNRRARPMVHIAGSEGGPAAFLRPGRPRFPTPKQTETQTFQHRAADARKAYRTQLIDLPFVAACARGLHTNCPYSLSFGLSLKLCLSRYRHEPPAGRFRAAIGKRPVHRGVLATR